MLLLTNQFHTYIKSYKETTMSPNLGKHPFDQIITQVNGKNRNSTHLHIAENDSFDVFLIGNNATVNISKEPNGKIKIVLYSVDKNDIEITDGNKDYSKCNCGHYYEQIDIEGGRCTNCLTMIA